MLKTLQTLNRYRSKMYFNCNFGVQSKIPTLLKAEEAMVIHSKLFFITKT